MSQAVRFASRGLFALICQWGGAALAEPDEGSNASVTTASVSASPVATQPAVSPPPEEAPLPKVAEPPAADDEGGLEVITVTAQKRSQDLQDVPSAVTALSSDTWNSFRSAGADIRALSARIPSLTIESSFGRVFPRMYIRGLGNTDFDLNASQPVSMVVDNVVLENPVVKSFPMFDVERVEVLRGPQGTLFGRNTPAGVVKFDTKKPTEDFEAFARLGYGQWNFMNFEGVASGPIVEGLLTARLSLMYQRRDDWVDNTRIEAVADQQRLGLQDTGTARPDQTNLRNITHKDLEGYSQAAARFQLDFRPTDDIRILANIHGHTQDGTARVFRANIIEPGTEDFTADYDRGVVEQDGANSQKLEQIGANINFDYDLGPATFTTIFSYERASFYTRGDIDGGYGAAFAGLNGPGVIPFPSETADGIPLVQQVTLESRVSTNDLKYVNGQIGMFFFDEELEIESFSYNTLGGGGQDGYAQQRQKAVAYAVFGTVMVDPVEELHLQGGFRWSDDQKTLTAQRLTSPIGAGPTGTLREETKASFLSWDLSATFDLFEDISVYARLARGFRAPSIQGRVLYGDALSVADSEKVLSFEAGPKMRFWRNRARVNLTGFYYQITDQQLTAVGGATNFNTLLNAEKGVGYGAELEAQVLATPNFEIGFGGSYNHTEIRDPNLAVAPCASGCTVLDPAGAVAGTVSIDGNALPNAPEFIFNLNLTYTARLNDTGALYFNTDWAYRSRVYFFLYESAEYTDAYLLEVGARVGYRRFDGKIEVAAYVRNLLDDNSRTGGIDFNNLTGFVNEPRVFGLEGSFRF